MTWTISAFADEAGSTTEQQIAALQRANLTHIDVRNVEDHNISELPLDVAEAMARKLGDAGITVAMFGSPIGKIDIADDMQVDLDKLEHLAKLRDVFGCNAVRIFSYYNKGEQAMDTWQRESVDRLSRLRDLAGKLGLVLYHENERHIFGDKLEQVQVIAEQLRNGDSFRMIFDFDNYNQSGDDVWNNWTHLKDKTDAFHFKDSTKDKMHVPLGQGNGQAPKILADAVAAGWSGPCSIEPHVKRSKAVLATGVSGQANQALADMSAADSFQVACDAVHAVLKQVGADYR